MVTFPSDSGYVTNNDISDDDLALIDEILQSDSEIVMGKPTSTTIFSYSNNWKKKKCWSTENEEDHRDTDEEEEEEREADEIGVQALMEYERSIMLSKYS